MLLYLYIHSLHIQAEKGLPTAEEAYNFFTFNFEPDLKDGTEKISKKRQKQKKAAEEDRDEEGEGEDAEEQEDGDVDEVEQDENEDQVRENKFSVCTVIISTWSE